MSKLLIILVLAQLAKCNFVSQLKVNFPALTGDCAKLMKEVDLNNTNWFYNMMDATSKFPPGIMLGNRIDFGNFDQCVEIEEATSIGLVRGQYCPRSIIVQDGKGGRVELSACIPSVCDLNTFFVKNFDTITHNYFCHTKELVHRINNRDRSVIALILIIAFLLISTTGYDIYTRRKGNVPSAILSSFSILTNAKKLFYIREELSPLDCLNGLRSLSAFWICLGHRFSEVQFTACQNKNHFQEWKRNLSSVYIEGALLAVDTFFYLSGFLLAFTVFQNRRRAILKAYGLRLFRILPLLTMNFLFVTSIMRMLFIGPLVWPLYIHVGTTCIDQWYYFFSFLQNYLLEPLEDIKICLPHTWYLSADVQLFVIAAFLLIVLHRYYNKGFRKSCYTILILIGTTSTLTTFYVDIFWHKTSEYATHPRIPVYIIGILMGIFLSNVKDWNLKIHHFHNKFIWCIVLIIMLTSMYFAQQNFIDPTTFSRNFTNAVVRPSWGLALSWVIYSCSHGTGGYISKILSFKIYQVFARLSYGIYLIHPIFLGVHLAQIRAPMYFSNFVMINYYIGDMFFTTLASIVLVICIEMPFNSVGHWLFGDKPTERKKTT